MVIESLVISRVAMEMKLAADVCKKGESQARIVLILKCGGVTVLSKL